MAIYKLADLDTNDEYEAYVGYEDEITYVAMLDADELLVGMFQYVFENNDLSFHNIMGDLSFNRAMADRICQLELESNVLEY